MSIRTQRNGNGSSIDQLVVDLSRADTAESIGDTIAAYCGKAFHSPAGLVFVRRDSELQILSQWPQKPILEKPPGKITQSGPIARTLATGKPVVWCRQDAPVSNIGRYFYRLLRRSHARHMTFLPMVMPGGSPRGVLAMVLPQSNELGPVLHEDLLQFGHVVSGCVVRALEHYDAITARQKAEDAVRTKDEFLSVLSHELKNPMMPILGWAVALSSRSLPDDKQNIAIEGIIRSVRALNYLIDDLFDAMRISAGKFSLEFTETRIQDVAREALAAIQHTVAAKKLRISTEISEAVPAFVADPRRLHQVLMNLLNNAVKFTPAGGAIALRIRRRDQSVECVVSDSGKGIERKFLPFVFERFRQEKRASKIHAAGLGLGLAIVREIVELHGGSIEAFSNGTDKGSTFIVRLPLRRRNGRHPRPVDFKRAA